MTSFLSQETIKAAVDRLGEARAQSTVVDYYVFKRALIIANADGDTDSVVTGTKAVPYVTAIDELAKVANPGSSDLPYFSPFGARRDKGRGFKSKKYPSNGPSDTVNRWQSRPDRPVDLVPGSTPKAFRPVERSAAELERSFLVAASSAGSTHKPQLLDFAIWYHRAADVTAIVDGEDGAVSLADRLIGRTVGALGITDVERVALFETDEEADIALVPDSPASPAFYLPVPPAQTKKVATPTTAASATTIDAAVVEDVVKFVAAKGFVFDPWQIAAFVTAVRTKPFVILAGISGTGKTKLPKLVAEATGAHFHRIPVRPDWTDSSELLGYERLGVGNTFVPGHLLRVARTAQENPDQQFFVLLDEMNVARVEYYLAEVLSHLEERSHQADGTIASDPLVPNASASEWASVRLPGNLTIVGSVNMDETTFGFSRKVLDRSFVIEFSTVSLSSVNPLGELTKGEPW
ncbi:MAG: AAA family ATPase, partial [Acidimicrobiales bacterium]|nr:AAA family ATPase [Acidimicrobiales bacterium]